MEVGERKIKLYCPCPSASKLLQIIARDDQKLDLGSISRAFGLDPKTLKLNGHFVSRGLDLGASSVTWRSLIGFFSARGLPTGATRSDALLVDGKFFKLGSKRSHCSEDSKDGGLKDEKQGYIRENKRAQHEHCSVLHKEKVVRSGCDSGQIDDSRNRTTGIQNESSGSGLKRKCLLADESDLKRTKYVPDERKDNILTNGRVSCSFISRNTKRTRDGEMVASSPS